MEFATFWTTFWTLWDGVTVTLWVSMVSAVLALAIGFVGAIGRTAELPGLRQLTSVYVAVFRNTPLLIQLYVFYRGLASAGLTLPPEVCGVLALSLYTGAYLVEVFRSAFLAIPHTQFEAGLALGLSRWDTYRMVLLPQALRVMLPPTSNILIALTKNSSLVAFITVPDLFFALYKGAVDGVLIEGVQPALFFVAGALWYALMAFGISAVAKGIEMVLGWSQGEGPVGPKFWRASTP